jgi:cytochrome P450
VGYRGNLLELMHNPIRYLRAVWRRYGNFAAVCANDPNFVCAFGPEYNRVLLSKDALFDQYFTVIPTPENSAFSRFTRNALVANGEEHRRQRRAMSPPFLRRRTEAYRDEMVSVAEHALRDWRPGQPLELTHALRRLTLGTILQVVFGVDLAKNPEVFAEAEVLLGEFLAQLGSKAAIVFPVDLPRSPYRRLLELAERVERFVGELLRSSAARRTETSVPGQLDASNRELGSPDPDADLMGQLVTLLLAGQETTNNALAWTLLLLAQHPRVLGALYEELRAELHGGAPAVAQLERLPLLDAVVHESLRLFPPAANGARRAKVPVELGAHRLPEGSVIIFSEYVSHHLPDVFPNPEHFMPERFFSHKPSPFEFLPFGAGARSCLGNHFALLEMKIAVALIVQRVWPEVVNDTHIDFELKPALAPKRGIPIVLRSPSRLPRPARLTGQIHDALDLSHVP